MVHKAESVFGIFHVRADLDHAVKVLKGAGSHNADISVLFPKAPRGAVAGAGPGVALGGSLGSPTTGVLVGMGIPEDEAKRYEDVVKGGGFLISVHSERSALTKKLKSLLAACGAKDVVSTGLSPSDQITPEMHTVF